MRAGLGMVEALGQLNTRPGGERGVHLAMRLGIYRLVVVGDGEVAPGGNSWRWARRPSSRLVQGLAMPDTVLISAATARLVQDLPASHWGRRTSKVCPNP